MATGRSDGGSFSIELAHFSMCQADNESYDSPFWRRNCCIMAEMAQSDHFPKKMAGGAILSSVYLMPATNVQIDEECCGGLNESYCPAVYYHPHG